MVKSPRTFRHHDRVSRPGGLARFWKSILNNLTRAIGAREVLAVVGVRCAEEGLQSRRAAGQGEVYVHKKSIAKIIVLKGIFHPQ